MKANSEKTKQSKKATRRVLAGVLCGASVLSLVLSLVMPPISQAIANDTQTVPTEETVMGGGSSSESADVENTNNGDAENQNSDETEGDETNPTNDVEQNQAEDQFEDEQRGEDGETSDDNAVKAVAEGGQAETASGEIDNIVDSGDELKNKLESAKGTANFELASDIDTSTTIQLDEDGSNITLDLKGHKIKHTSQRQPLFNITGGATLTIKDTDPKKPSESVDDGKQLNDQVQNFDPNNYGQEAKLVYDTDGIPSSLTYYVTQSSPRKTDTTKTTETLYKHSVDIKGAIVACDGTDGLRLINLYATNSKGGTFKLESGVITQQQNTQQNNNRVDSLVYAENGSTVNMSGGYVCGASSGNTGAGIMVNTNGGASFLDLTGGVIAANYAPKGAGVYSNGSNVSISKDAVISGNATFNGESDQPGYGGGIMAEGGSVTVSGGYITNNKYAKFCGEDGQGGHGGAGLAANNGAHVTISGGQITGNYSEEAGGGVYVTNIFQHDRAWLDIKGGIIASNVSYRSEGAGIRVGQMIDAMISGASKDSPVYITNNHCMSRFDWGGGGIFVQGDSNVAASNAGMLFVYNSYISANTAGGYGGGVAVCPTGKTLVTNTEGTAIFGNSSAGEEHDDNHFNNENVYNKEKNTGNEAKPHLSGGGGEKTEDRDAYGSEVFRKNGHADFFLAAKKGHTDPIAAVIGKMLGGGDAQYSGSKELKEAIDIPANGGVQIYQSIGLTSGVQAGSDEATAAQKAATTFITGNYSWDHGGGIMSNGDLYLGQPADTYVYPSLKLKATKKLIDSQTDKNKTLTGNEFTFTVYRKDSKDPFVNGKFNRDACAEVGTANNDASGNITFKLGEQFAASGTADKITYYLVEDTGEDSDITYDSAVYEIVASVRDTKTELMTVPTKENPNRQIPLNIHNYTIENVGVTKHELDKSSGEWSVTNSWDNVQNRDGYYLIACEDSSVTFTNEYTPYNSYGSWTPKATKVVKGGEMKEFTLEFADNEKFEGNNVRTVKTDATGGATQTLPFLSDSNEGVKYSLSDITKDPYIAGDSTGRGASKTFTYYVHEKDESSPLSHYKYDKSVYRFDVTMTDQKNRSIVATKVTYTQIKDADGKKIDPNKQVPVKFDSTNPEEHGPTFTNTYSTSLPLSGMSGVTLTYLAGAAVLCAAAAWMHIRRKANAKGGKRHE